MRTIALTKKEAQSDIIPRLKFNYLEISRFEGNICQVCFSNSSGEELREYIRVPQLINIQEISQKNALTISQIQFFFKDEDCKFVCELK